METKIELKPFKKRDGKKYRVIQITDFQLHTNTLRESQSVGNKIKRAFKNQEPDRIYYPLKQPSLSGKNKITLDLLKLDPDFIQMIKDEESKGYTVLLDLPKEGIPIFAGEDTKEFLNSKKGKRITRRLAKQKSIE